MSFGVGVGDILTLSRLCTDLYRACKHSTKEFKDISAEVANLHLILEDLQDDLRQDGVKLSPRREERLRMLLTNAHNALHALQQELARYDSLTTDRQRKYEVVRFGFKEVGEIRMRIISVNTSLNAIEHVLSRLANNQLRKIILKHFREVRDKQAEGYERSSFTKNTAESIVKEESWDGLKNELEEVGIDGDVLAEKKGFITGLVQQAMQDGDLPDTDLDLVSTLTSSDPASSALTLAATASAPSLGTAADDTGDSAGKKPLHRWDTDATLIDDAYARRRQITDPVARADAEVSDLLALQTKGGRGSSKKNGRLVGLVLRTLRIASDERLIEAADEGDAAKTVRLIRRGANARATDKWQWTPLHMAAYGGYDSIARILILHGADIAARTVDGETPLLLAERNGHKGVVDIISQEAERRERENEINAERAEGAAANRGKEEAAGEMVLVRQPSKARKASTTTDLTLVG